MKVRLHAAHIFAAVATTVSGSAATNGSATTVSGSAATNGSATVIEETVDLKDSPYLLTIFQDSPRDTLTRGCHSRWPGNLATALQATGKTALNDSAPDWTQQTWMSVQRTVDEDNFTDNMKHCWRLQEGGPSSRTEFKSFKLYCNRTLDQRAAMNIKWYKDSDECNATEEEDEEFYTSANNTRLSDGTGDVIELVGLFSGHCTKFNKKLWWAFDRPVHIDDYPNCYEKALRDFIHIRRQGMQSGYDEGIVMTTAGTSRGAAPFFTTLFTLVALHLRLRL